MYNTPRTRRNGMQVGACFDSVDCSVPQVPSTQEKLDLTFRSRHASAPLPQVSSLHQKGTASEEETSGRETKRPRAVEDLSAVREDLVLVEQLNCDVSKGSKDSPQSKLAVERPNRALPRAQSIDSANVGDTAPLRGGLRAKTLSALSDTRESGELTSCVHSLSSSRNAQEQGATGQEEEPRQREPSVQRRVSVAIRPDILGELPEKPANGRSRGRRVTLSMVDETMEELRDTLQKKVEEIPDARHPCDKERKFPKEGRELPKEGREMLPPLNQAAVSSGNTLGDIDEGRASRGDITADLQQLQRALRDIIPSGRELEEAKCGTTLSTTSTASGSGASTCSTKSSTRTTRQNSNAGVRTPKSRQRSAHRHHLEELPESGELENMSTPTNRLESKFKVCSNSLADELARLDSKCSDGPSGNASEGQRHARRTGEPVNIQRRGHRLFTS